MIVTRLIKGIISGSAPHPAPPEQAAGPAGDHLGQRLVLNVGGGSKQIAIPDHYRGWDHCLLDIAAGPDVDVVCDARRLIELDADQFDAVYCSHNLEHYFRHDAAKVLAGFLHILKPEGFAEIRVPDMGAVVRHMVSANADIDDVLYQSAAGPISIHDVFYGWGKQIESSGVDFYAHKCGFTSRSLAALIECCGFFKVFVAEHAAGFEIRALAFKQEPGPHHAALFGL